jgi:hypothetical protein
VDLNQQKQQFSIAYVRAVAAVAGYNVYKQEVDDESVDLGIAPTGVESGVPFMEQGFLVSGQGPFSCGKDVCHGHSPSGYGRLCIGNFTLPEHMRQIRLRRAV